MKIERNLPPAEFQERLTYLGGVNRYDEPNFRIWWSQYGHGDGIYKSGGIWSVDEAYFRGYRDLLKGSANEPCYCLGQWHDASEYGSPERYYMDNLDEESGLQILGEFPYSGRVELLYSLRWYEKVGDKLTFHTMPLTTQTFDLIVPIILAARDISYEKRKAAWLDAQAQQEKEKLDQIERHLRDNAVPFGGAVSYGRQGIRSTVIDQKMIDLQRAWNNMSRVSLRPGLTTR